MKTAGKLAMGLALVCTLASMLASTLIRPAQAEAGEAWSRLNGTEISAALTDATIDYESGARQEFRASGRSYYAEEAGPLEVGQWQVQGNRYCSQWSPQGPWSCYILEQSSGDERRLRFVGERGDLYPGRLRARP